MLLGDVIADVIGCYQAIRRHPEAVSWALNVLVAEGTDEASYYHVRATQPHAPVVAAARLIYLNRLGYNGLYRTNRAGVYNVPYGHFTKFGRDEVGGLPSPVALKAIAAALATAALCCQDFGVTIAGATAGDVIFCDPPYVGTFVNYSKDGFSVVDQQRLAAALRAADHRGAAVVLTQTDCPEVRAAYSWATILPTAELRRVNRDASRRGPVSCVLVSNVPELVQEGGREGGGAEVIDAPHCAQR